MIHFVGPDGKHDKLLNKVKSTKSSYLYAMAHVVYQWLATLRKIRNPLYQDEPELPDLEMIQNSLSTTINSLIDESINTFDTNAINQMEVKTDDVVGIQA